ncbi:hypothetical protein DES53_11540 [Roseimicrobium gellanilyticum]|uniref:Uncharacterized protein n=2 Tax=Roseimicrobium gellanilyticum TaxID=748857 RepID=A0A366H4Q8_9BACT|nr:hypothetical protein DES53_11540 [Roseimicrobium gellanilyticum]
MAVTAALLLLTLPGTSCTSTSFSSSPSDDESVDQPFWGEGAAARGQKVIRLGNPKRPAWGWADVPVEVVTVAKTRLKPPASSWDVSHHWHDDESTYEVLCLDDDDSVSCLFICTRGKWMLMEGEQGLRQTSLMEHDRLQKLRYLSAGDLKRLCGRIAYLGARSGGYVPHAGIRNEERAIRAWLGGEVKDADVLRKYCVDPAVVQEGAAYVITWYVLTREGSLELWNARAQTLDDGRREIVGITFREVLKKGSFRWGLVP